VLLEVLDYRGPAHWRWRLVSAGGEFLADHQVSLDTGQWQYEAFTDLHHYLRHNAVPDRRLAHMAELSRQVGDWIAETVLGPIGPELASSRRHVRLEVPAEAAELAYRPWELARLDGQTLAERRVGFIVDQPHPAVAKAPIGERLRMLAVFSLPEDAGALNLRKERVALAHLVHDIAAVNNKGIELRVLQYGATRERLESALLEESGWDVVHISGHGLPAGLVLEDDTGRQDLITSTELVDLLDLATDHIKLVTLSACESAAVTAAEHLQQIGLASPVPIAADGSESLPAIATELVRRLDCAVLAMRYPVMDGFAIDLARAFYDLVLGKGKSVAQALAVALPKTAEPGISLATPTLFGARAADLKLTPPPGGPLVLDVTQQKLARFPAQPDRFVGRVGPMTRATTALAPRSGQPGVLFHGMAGAGKTACALELAYVHQESFPLMAWHAAAPEGHDIRTALTDFLMALEQQLPGLKIVHLVADAVAFRQFLPTLTEILEQNRVLVVLDNIESLLAENGDWRDERWQWLVDAMTNHRGLSRLILTSRLLTPVPGVQIEAVHALSLGESMLLARELPNLRALIDSDPVLAKRTLSVVQGHPKLIELADGLAADPANLAERLDDTDETWHVRGTSLEQFLRSGESAASDEDFFAVLVAWTRAIVSTLPEDATVLLQFLCCMEEDDRQHLILLDTWPPLWELLGRTGTAPDIGSTMAPLIGQALVDKRTDRYRIHSAVAEAVRVAAPTEFRTTVDDQMVDFWASVFTRAVEDREGKLGKLVNQTAHSGAPYFVRRRHWEALTNSIQEVLRRDTTEATVAAFLPFLEIAVRAVQGTDLELRTRTVHAQALAIFFPGRVGGLQEILDSAVTAGESDVAATVISHLVSAHQFAGRHEEARAVLAAYPDRALADAGPWTQVQNDMTQVQLMIRQGQPQQGLDLVRQLQARMAALPDATDTGESVEPWSVRENVMTLGAIAANKLGEWQLALEFTAGVLRSVRQRGGSPVQLARIAFNDYFALLSLDRTAEARDLLQWCRTEFENAKETSALGKVIGAQAELEDRLGRHDRAVDLCADALRLSYLTGELESIMVAHHSLGNHLTHFPNLASLCWTTMCAAAVIQYQAGGAIGGNVESLSRTLVSSRLPDDATSFEYLCSVVDRLDGVHFAELAERLPRRAPNGQAALDEVLRLANELADGRREVIVQQWEPVIAALAGGEQIPEGQFEARGIGPVLRRVQAGERGQDLLDGLNLVHAAVVRRALERLGAGA
jgi:hypothetical protein